MRTAQSSAHAAQPASSVYHQALAVADGSGNPAASAQALRWRPASASAPFERATWWYSSSQRSSRGSWGAWVIVA